MILAAIDAVSAGRFASARHIARNDADVLPAALVLFATRDYHDAFVAFTRARGGRAEWLAYERATRIGWDRHAAAAIAAGVIREPRDPRWRAAGLSLFARVGDDDAALEHGRVLLEVRPDAVSAMVEMAGIHAMRGEKARARELVERARATSSAAPVRLETERILSLRPDDEVTARRVLCRALVHPVGDVDAALAALGTNAAERARRTLRSWQEDREVADPAESLRRAGRVQEAIALLTPRAKEGHPGACLNLVLSHALAGDEPRARAAAERAEDVAPGPVAEAARAMGVELRGDDGARASLDELIAVFEHAIVSLRGNRSRECTTYVTPEGLIQGSRPIARRDRQAHDLAEARALVGSSTALGALPTPLSPAEVAAFIESGYVCLRGALSPALIERWRAEAARTLGQRARAGELRLSGGPPTEEVSLLALDLEDPSTWPTGTLVHQGEQRARLNEVAPAVLGAVAQLLGGEARIATSVLSDYLIVRFPGDDPHEQNWHIDEPGAAMTLDNVRNGIVALILFSDVAPDGGATILCPESVSRVAQRLAGSKEGVDFTETAIGRNIAAETTVRVACAGSAGDVYLAHPFMVHGPSANRRPTLRWLSNLMVHVTEPLRPDGSSPVELAIARALQSNTVDHRAGAR